MSKKKNSRNKRDPDQSSRSHKNKIEPRTHRPANQQFWLSSFLTSALAAIFSMIVFLQLGNPAGLLNAITRRELREMDWKPIHRRYIEALQQDTQRGHRHAVAQLMSTLIALRDKRITAEEAVAAGRQESENDLDNLLSRLIYAAIIDMQATEAQHPNADPLDRFKRIGKVIDNPRPASVTTLYNAKLFAAWQESLEPYFRRPDVAAALKQRPPPVRFPQSVVAPIQSHISALPIAEQQFSRLAKALKESKHAGEAALCRAWFARSMLGLIQSEPSAATRLLCVDLLARCLVPESPAATSLRSLRDDFQARSDAAPRDVGDQSDSVFGGPAVDPEAYQMAFDSLLTALGFVIAAAAGGLLWILAVLMFLLIWVAKRSRRTNPVETHWPLSAKIISVIIPPTVATGILIVQSREYGLYSPVWLFVILLTAFVFGSTGIITAAGLPVWRAGRISIGRMILVVILSLVPIALLILPPIVTARVCRQFDLWIGTPAVVLPVAAVWIIIALWVCPANLKSIARTAAFAWCINIIVALAIVQWHRGADLRHQQAAVAGRADELAARLGADWQNKYLGPARTALGMETP